MAFRKLSSHLVLVLLRGGAILVTVVVLGACKSNNIHSLTMRCIIILVPPLFLECFGRNFMGTGSATLDKQHMARKACLAMQQANKTGCCTSHNIHTLTM